MQKLLYSIVLGILGLTGFTRASVNSLSVSPATQSAISGSVVTFLVTGSNGTGDVYLKHILPVTVLYNVTYQNATPSPINSNMLSLGIEHDPIFLIPANTSFSFSITAKVISTVRTFSPISVTPIISDTTLFANVLTSALALLTPIADLSVTNVMTSINPSLSGDVVLYTINLQNIGSAQATGITFISNFPIPTLGAPAAIFNGTFHNYSYINYPQDFVWNGSYLNGLNGGQVMNITISAPMTQAFPAGTTFNQLASAVISGSEYTTGNNSALATGIVTSAADVWITKTLAPFTGFTTGDQVTYTLTYGNSGGQSATNVVITDLAPVNVTIPTTTFSLGTLPGGSGGTITLTGTFSTLLTSGYVFVNTANITTTSPEVTTGNNSAAATGTIAGVVNASVSILANNLTRPQFDNAPYGSGPSILIQAVSGDIVQLTLSYIYTGNVTGANAVLSLSGVQGFTSLGVFNGTIGTLQFSQAGTFVITGIVGPRNYISFTPIVRLTYNTNQVVSDSVIIQEPLVCGDGLLTQTEACDTQGNLGVNFSGQVCENQQGICALVTQSIINVACINYQYTNTFGVIATGQSCDSVTIALTNASCSIMTGSTPTTTNNGYTVNYTCQGLNATPTTPISINCGNGTSISGSGTSLSGTCSYASSFVGNAQCSVGNDTSNVACRVPVAPNQVQCELTALDGNIVIIDDNGDGEGSFTCETANNVITQEIKIDCGIGGISDQGGRYAYATNASYLGTTCSYNVNTPPTNKVVTCSTNGVICANDTIIVDESSLGYCGDGIREGYEDCDDGSDNGTSNSTCSLGCDLGNPLMGCFNIGNTNISIQKGEILPFRWTLDKTNNIIPGDSCVNKPDGKIPEDTIYCTFSVYNGQHLESDFDPVYTFVKRCNEDNRGTSALFAYFLDKQDEWRSLAHAFGKYYIGSNNFVTDIFGEYKIVLDRVEYQYCRSDDLSEGAILDRVCSVDFTVTQPYVAQKSSFGITPRATNIRLDGYQTILGDELIRTTDLANIMVLDESVYNASNKVQAMVNTFITKYDRLAITVPASSLTNTAFAGLDVTVKVVPKQKIYILKSDTHATITLANISSFTTPFTIVTKNIDLVIKGNVDYNGMFLVKDGTIKFEKSDEIIGEDRCPSTQIVKGIFVTDEGFLGGEVLDNINLNKKRCTYGGLNVQGILIGNNIENIVNAKRAQLNHWFYVGGTSEAAIKAERRNEIFKGASLLIEYSPSLWNALPPGASEFTTALDIYKQ